MRQIRFEAGEYFVPELLVSARAMKSALALVRPLLAESGAQPGSFGPSVNRIGRADPTTGNFHVDLRWNLEPNHFPTPPPPPAFGAEEASQIRSSGTS